jgi:hypothetical protein
MLNFYHRDSGLPTEFSDTTDSMQTFAPYGHANELVSNISRTEVAVQVDRARAIRFSKNTGVVTPTIRTAGVEVKFQRGAAVHQTVRSKVSKPQSGQIGASLRPM